MGDWKADFERLKGIVAASRDTLGWRTNVLDLIETLESKFENLQQQVDRQQHRRPLPEPTGEGTSRAALEASPEEEEIIIVDDEPVADEPEEYEYPPSKRRRPNPEEMMEFEMPTYTNEIEGQARFTFLSISDDELWLEVDAMTKRKSAFEIRFADIDWRLDVVHTNIMGNNYLHFYLICNNLEVLERDTRLFFLSTKIVIQSGPNAGTTRPLKDVIDIPTWEKFLDKNNEFLTADDSLVIEARWSCVKRAVTPFNRPIVSTLCLLVEEQRVHVSRDLLAFHSVYFNHLLYEVHPDDDEVPLEDIRHEDFIELLQVIHPDNKPVDRKNVLILADLSVQLDMPMLQTKCNEYFKKENMRYFQMHYPYLDVDQPRSYRERWKRITAESSFWFRVQGRRMRVNKEILALFSPYFHTIFTRQYFSDSGADEVELKEVLAAEFEQFLEVLYSSMDGIRRVNNNNVAFLLELADRFVVPSVTYQCAEFLYTKSFEKDEYEFAMRMADRFRLRGFRSSLLRDKVWKSYRYKADFLKTLSPETRDFILEHYRNIKHIQT